MSGQCAAAGTVSVPRNWDVSHDSHKHKGECLAENCQRCVVCSSQGLPAGVRPGL